MEIDIKKLEVGIVVRDLEAVTPFYRDGLGLTHVGDMQTKLGLNRRFAWGEHIVIVVMQLTDPPTIAHPSRGTAGEATGVRFLVLREDELELEEVLERCEATGGKPFAPIMDMGAWRLLIIEDPEGTCHIEVTTRVR
jgi:predicted enzyme related to lactoylglutathione lyase